MQILPGYHDLIDIAVGIGVHRGGVNISGQIGRAGFFGKDQRNAELLRDKAADGDAGGFNGEDFIHLFPGKAGVEFLRQFGEQHYIDLMIEKAIDAQNIAGGYFARTAEVGL